MKIFLAHASAFPFEEKLYAPLRASALSREHTFLFPEEQKYGGIWNTKEEIAKSDVLVVDVSVPSTGAGIEMGWAETFNVPIIAIHEKGSTPSATVSYVTTTVIVYDDSDDLISKLTPALDAIKK